MNCKMIEFEDKDERVHFCTSVFFKSPSKEPNTYVTYEITKYMR